jgi:hypothetical protein
MRANGFKPFDDVADSMSNAASRLGVPIGAIKAAKRGGSPSFRGSRINITRLRNELASAAKEPSLSDMLLSIVKEVANAVGSRLPHRDARFRADCGKLTEAIHNGFGCVLGILEPDSADDFLQKSASIMESIFAKSTRKKAAASRSTRRRMAAKNIEALRH